MFGKHEGNQQQTFCQERYRRPKKRHPLSPLESQMRKWESCVDEATHNGMIQQDNQSNKQTKCVIETDNAVCENNWCDSGVSLKQILPSPPPKKGQLYHRASMNTDGAKKIKDRHAVADEHDVGGSTILCGAVQTNEIYDMHHSIDECITDENKNNSEDATNSVDNKNRYNSLKKGIAIDISLPPRQGIIEREKRSEQHAQQLIKREKGRRSGNTKKERKNDATCKESTSSTAQRKKEETNMSSLTKIKMSATNKLDEKMIPPPKRKNEDLTDLVKRLEGLQEEFAAMAKKRFSKMGVCCPKPL
mmetsp:Transcript_28517/g.41998  ORF Transcript_28517/g.41998 Transcript_28517/m.41998 type:complete len:304 (+) Transcript_28517:371-1282(+)